MKLLSILILTACCSFAPLRADEPTATSSEREPSADRNVFSFARFDGVGKKSLKDLGWQGGNLEEGKKDFSVVTEGGKTFIRSSYILGTEAKYLYKELEMDQEVYPYLRWKWRARKFPPKGNILDSKVSDAPAQIYVLWRYFPRYYVLKYFWGGKEPVGSVLNDGNVFTGSLYGLVIRSGPPWNTWHTETRNILEDYQKAFGQKPRGNVRGIAILSDGDDSKGESEADYADFEGLKHP